MKKNKDAIIKTTYVFSKNNQVLVKKNVDDNIWCPTNFHWMPMIALDKQIHS